MYQDDHFNPADPNEYDNVAKEDALTKILKEDKGLNIVTRKVTLDSGIVKNKRIKVYTSGSSGTKIRDAETGEFYPYKVGSKNEDIFFKVIIATGECNSANGSNTVFYCSPQHYENHLCSSVYPEIIAKWEAKRDARLKELKMEKKPKFESIEVK
jgi:hypothetical protein